MRTDKSFPVGAFAISAQKKPHVQARACGNRKLTSADQTSCSTCKGQNYENEAARADSDRLGCHCEAGHDSQSNALIKSKGYASRLAGCDFHQNGTRTRETLLDQSLTERRVSNCGIAINSALVQIASHVFDFANNAHHSQRQNSPSADECVSGKQDSLQRSTELAFGRLKSGSCFFR